MTDMTIINSDCISIRVHFWGTCSGICFVMSHRLLSFALLQVEQGRMKISFCTFIDQLVIQLLSIS